MAKYRHKTFEMFEHYDEAVATLKLRPREKSRVHDLDGNTFEHLTVRQSENAVRIGFQSTPTEDDESACRFRDEFSRMADCLQNDSRVIIDFEGVQHVPAAAIETLEYFYRKLKAKGSRLVLCNLGPDAKSCFYPARVPR